VGREKILSKIVRGRIATYREAASTWKEKQNTSIKGAIDIRRVLGLEKSLVKTVESVWQA